MVVLATLVLFNQAAKIENINDFNDIIHFEDSTSLPSKIELFRPNGRMKEINKTTVYLKPITNQF